MLTRLSAEVLKRDFGAYGNFYNLRLGTKTYPCRSVLELLRHDITPLRLNDISTQRPDLVCVMLNPGGSRPADGAYSSLVIDDAKDIQDRRNLVVTKPDVTQWQIVRLLKHKEWSHARVLNLSDLRESQSNNFIKTLDDIASCGLSDLHSIFCNFRREELNEFIPDASIPILVGWGRDSNLRSLAGAALTQLSKHRIVGVSDDTDPNLFSHPSPMLQSMKDKWLGAIIPQLDGL